MHKHSYLKYLRKKNPTYTMNHPKYRKNTKGKKKKCHREFTGKAGVVSEHYNSCLSMLRSA